MQFLKTIRLIALFYSAYSAQQVCAMELHRRAIALQPANELKRKAQLGMETAQTYLRRGGGPSRTKSRVNKDEYFIVK
jgi:hypothetical protein